MGETPHTDILLDVEYQKELWRRKRRLKRTAVAINAIAGATSLYFVPKFFIFWVPYIILMNFLFTYTVWRKKEFSSLDGLIIAIIGAIVGVSVSLAYIFLWMPFRYMYIAFYVTFCLFRLYYSIYLNRLKDKYDLMQSQQNKPAST